MSWSTRGERAYEYRSVRRSGRVTSRYLGGGIPAEAGELFRWLDAGRRAERAAARAAWEAERDRMRAAERLTIETDDAYGAVAEAAMLATGHHRPSRGRWRKRRTMSTEIKTAKSDHPLVTGREMTDLLDRIEGAVGNEKQELQDHAHRGIQLLLKWAKAGDERALPALRVVLAHKSDYFGRLGALDFAIKAAAMAAGGTQDVLIRDVFVREIEATVEQLAGPDASPLERLLCQRLALANHDALHMDTFALESEMNGCSIEKSEFLSRQRNRSTARFLAAARSLATVRRLAVPVLRVHLAATATAPARAVEPSEASTPRLRLGSLP